MSVVENLFFEKFIIFVVSAEKPITNFGLKELCLDTKFRISLFLVKFNFILSDFLILDSLKLSILKSETAAEKIATSAGKFF